MQQFLCLADSPSTLAKWRTSSLLPSASILILHRSAAEVLFAIAAALPFRLAPGILLPPVPCFFLLRLHPSPAYAADAPYLRRAHPAPVCLFPAAPILRLHPRRGAPSLRGFKILSKIRWTGRRGSGVGVDIGQIIVKIESGNTELRLDSQDYEERIKMPKRPGEELGGGRSAKLPTRQRKRLYLVLDDWELGYSIRRVDLLLGFDSDEGDDGSTEQRLPRAVFRLEAPRARPGQFTAFGTKIMFMKKFDNPWNTMPVYDVCTRALTSGPLRNWETTAVSCAYVQVDGKLFVMDEGVFEMLQPPPPPIDRVLVDVKFDWSWRELPSPPYQYVVSYALHPDEQTMVFSMTKHSPKRKLATFSFDIESSRWTRHGAWGLPFKGRGYFDHDLDAWVGLAGDPDTLGHLCACNVLPAGDDNRQPPACKLSKERLFCVDAAEKHTGATLVYVGDDRAMFCLVECFSVDDRQGGVWKESMPERRGHLLRVTTFSLKYDKNGDLRIAKQRQIGLYRLPEIASAYCYHLERPVAFWM
nr:unnamed protein product [Digitaria exilis]